MKILVIDDEIDVCETICEVLSDKFETEYCTSPNKVLEHLYHKSYELIILDISFPDGNGFQVCSEIRSLEEYKDIPIIFLTGDSSESALVTGYRVGGDHFILKPFTPIQLMAIIERFANKITTKNIQSIYKKFGDLKAELNTQKIFCKEVPVDLSHKEFQLLSFFIANPDEIITRERLLSLFWKNNFEVQDRTIDYYVSQIRKKIDQSSCKIKAVYQEGYKLIA